MHNLIPLHEYTEDAYFKREAAGIRRAWHYACLRRDLSTDQDWQLVRIVDRDVVIQNFEGELRAFTNTCPHRFNAIRNADCGNGPLTCGYHRWTFDREGAPVGIPFRSTFENLDLTSLHLERWDLATAGDFVFVRPQGQTGDLATWLGSLQARLEGLSAAMGTPYARFSIEVAANWKLVVQNTLEFDHVYSVHPETFGAVVNTRPQLTAIDMPSPHVGYHAELAPAQPTRAIQKRVAAIFERSPVGVPNEHEHLSVFPLTAIGLFRRESISILRYVPHGPASTLIDTRLFLPAIEMTEAEQSLMTPYSEVMGDFGRKLGSEDRGICESLQRGSANLTSHRGAFGEGERIVWAFQRAYRDYMAAFGM